MSPGVQRLLRIGRNTADLDRAAAFYRDALGFHLDGISNKPPVWMRWPEVDVAPARCASLSLGAQQIVLTEFRDAAPYPANSSACDQWFQHCAIVVSDIHVAYERVMAHGVEPITHDGPQLLPPSTGSVSAFKFRDPDGHPLELIHFPAGVGDPVWQKPHATPATLGIDHSAISVGDVERSIRFYELLGLHVAARGVNNGAKQQRLDNLADVEVDVVALQPADARTPHLELLGYRSPRGRANPSARIDAIVADRLIWQVEDLKVSFDAMNAAGFGKTGTRGGPVGGVTAALLCDPDGHLNVLTEAVLDAGS